MHFIVFQLIASWSLSVSPLRRREHNQFKFKDCDDWVVVGGSYKRAQAAGA